MLGLKLIHSSKGDRIQSHLYADSGIASLLLYHNLNILYQICIHLEVYVTVLITRVSCQKGHTCHAYA